MKKGVADHSKLPPSLVFAHCAGKIAFASLQDAKAQVRRMTERSKSKGNGDRQARLKAYRCEFCRKYHIGNSRRVK